MGNSVNNFSTLSWDGKVADNPKPFGLTVGANGPLTEQDLADFETKMLKLVHEMSEKISKQQIDRNQENRDA